MTTAMSAGLLLLRAAFGLLLVGHGLQKALGWFHGPGLDTVSRAFDAWGFVPGRSRAKVAIACEVLGGGLTVIGFLTPMAAALAIGAMVVAAGTKAASGLWAASDGMELAMLYAVVFTCVPFTGPGTASIDHVLGIEGMSGIWGGTVAAAAALAGAAVVLVQRQHVVAGRAGEQTTPIS
jgi:putative oxidoreductase